MTEDETLMTLARSAVILLTLAGGAVCLWQAALIFQPPIKSRKISAIYAAAGLFLIAGGFAATINNPDPRADVPPPALHTGQAPALAAPPPSALTRSEQIHQRKDDVIEQGAEDLNDFRKQFLETE